MIYPKNFWYVIAMSHEIQKDITPRSILGQDVIIYRKSDGSTAAIEDRCPHRRVSLSLGRIIHDEVQCGYHGMRFDSQGKCTTIPNQSKIPKAACIRSYATEERDGFVWIWPGDPGKADITKIPDYSEFCSSADFTGNRATILEVQAPYIFNLENVLDLSHATFAHGETVGIEETAQTTPTVHLESNLIWVERNWEKVKSPPAFSSLFGFGECKRSQRIYFWPGGNIRLEIDVEPVGNIDPDAIKKIRVAGPCTPASKEKHYKFSAMYRNFEIGNQELNDAMARQFQKTILEDKVLMENQFRNWRQDGAELYEKSLLSSHYGMVDIAVDTAPLAARRLLNQLWLEEKASA